MISEPYKYMTDIIFQFLQDGFVQLFLNIRIPGQLEAGVGQGGGRLIEPG
jgi:hypothetical protein